MRRHTPHIGISGLQSTRPQVNLSLIQLVSKISLTLALTLSHKLKVTRILTLNLAL